MNYHENMEQNANRQPVESGDQQNRRELISQLGRLAVYTAPFTVMAANAKAATSSGPGPHARPSGAAPQ